MRSTSPGPGSRGSPEHRGQHRPAGSARLAGRSPRFPGWGQGRGGVVEEALGGSCRGGFESLLSSAIGLPLGVRASRCQRGAEGRAPCWASVPAPGIWLSVTQQLLTRPRAPYCVITATWHGFGPQEPPDTHRSLAPSWLGVGGAACRSRSSALRSGGSPPSTRPRKRRKQDAGTQRCHRHAPPGPTRQPRNPPATWACRGEEARRWGLSRLSGTCTKYVKPNSPEPPGPREELRHCPAWLAFGPACRGKESSVTHSFLHSFHRPTSIH